MNLRDRASSEYADAQKAKCPHVLSCKCWSKFRTHGWLVVDTLTRLGWTVTPPEESR